MRARSPLVATAAVAAALTVVSCADYVPPEGARISCASSADCPTGWTCEDTIDRCVPTEREDKTAPQASDIEIAPSTAGAGDTVTVSFVVNEPLDRDPQVAFGDEGPSDLERDTLAYDVAFVVPDGAPEDSGTRTITAELVDLFGNARTQSLGTVTLVYGAPPAPLAGAVSLREVAEDPEDPALVDGSAHRFFLAGNEGAVSAPFSVVYANEELSTPIGEPLVVAANESFPEVELPAGSARVWLVARDDAGNESPARTIAVPTFSALAIDAPSVGLTPTGVSFVASEALRADPVVTVGGTAGALVAQDGLAFSYVVTLDGTEPEGVNAAVLRVSGASAALAAANLGTDAVTVTVDFTPPTLTAALIAVVPGASPTEDTIVGAAGALADAAGVDARPATQLTVRVLDAGSAELGSAPVAADGSFGPIAIGDDENATVELVVTDDAGNETSASFSNDIGAPSLTALATSVAAVRSAVAFDITFTVEDDDTELATLPLVRVGTRDATHVSGALDVLGAPVTFTYTFAAADGLDTEGDTSVIVEVTDQDGNTASAATSILFDFTAPAAVDVTAPTVGAEWNASAPLTGTSADALSGVALVELSVERGGDGLYFDGAGFNSIAPAWVAASGSAPWSFDVGALPLTAGGVTVSARATDAVGNVGESGAALTFTFDGAPPQTSITAAPPALTTETDHTIAFACDDAPCTFSCAIDGAAASACTSPLAVTAGIGAHTIAVVATDAAGNVDPSPAVASFTVQRVFLEISQSVDSDHERACGVAQDGSLWCWGESRDFTFFAFTQEQRIGAPVRVDGGTTWAHVAVGQSHVCATQTDGSLWCFGDNSFAQLGLGASGGSQAEPQLVGSGGFGAVAAGEVGTCALRDEDADGASRVFCWGSNYEGSAGHAPENTPVLSPTEIDGDLDGFVSLSMGYATACAVRDDGDAYCFGSGGFSAALGDGTNDTRAQAAPIAAPPLGQAWIDVAQEGSGGCAVTDGGELWCWGSNGFGQAGVDPLVQYTVPLPTRVGVANDWLDVERGNGHVCGVRSGGLVSCFGAGFYGQRGDGVTTFDAVFTPVDVATGVDRVALGESITWLMRADGTTACAGRNGDGQCGVGTVGFKAAATVVASGVASFSLADYGALVLDGSGALRGAGQNDSGQLADGSTRRRATFTASVAPDPFANVDAGSGSACGITAAGALSCWGSDSGGMLGGGAGDQSPGPVSIAGVYSAVSVGPSTACAIDDGGMLWCWGNRIHEGFMYTVHEAPISIDAATDWQTISVGAVHACGLKTTGEAWCFGVAGEGQLGTGATGPTLRQAPAEVNGNRVWSQVAAGGSASCGIEAGTGLAFCWGSNSHGQLGGDPTASVATPLEVVDPGPWRAVAAAEDSVCGVKESGDVVCWGREQRTQLPYPTPTVVAAGAGALSVELGRFFTCFLDDGDALSCFGDNAEGQLGDGLGFLTSFTSMGVN